MFTVRGIIPQMRLRCVLLNFHIPGDGIRVCQSERGT